MCRLLWLIAIAYALTARLTVAEEYLGRAEFLQLAFRGEPVEHTLWLSGELRQAAQRDVGWAPRALRIRYWATDERTAWVLEDIGKEQLITIGVVIDEHRIERLDVLAFRESRGGEIPYPFFADQFHGLGLGRKDGLSEPVNGITGATLSVRATKRVARLALWLHSRVVATEQLGAVTRADSR